MKYPYMYELFSTLEAMERNMPGRPQWDVSDGPFIVWKTPDGKWFFCFDRTYEAALHAQAEFQREVDEVVESFVRDMRERLGYEEQPKP